MGFPLDDHPLRAVAEGFARSRAGAFLKRDRGGALYITDAPRFGAVSVPLGFAGEMRGGLMLLSPEDSYAEAFAEWALPRCADDPLFADFARFSGRAADAGSRALFIEGLKAVEARAPYCGIAAYDRRLRGLAAEALRLGAGGGALRACAACLAALSVPRRVALGAPRVYNVRDYERRAAPCEGKP